jgi:hypothetical protein
VHHYLPAAEDVEIVRVEVCIPMEASWPCVALEGTMDVWHTTLIDLSALGAGGAPLNEQQLPGFLIHFQAKATGTTEPSYAMYLDAIQVVGEER